MTKRRILLAISIAILIAFPLCIFLTSEPQPHIKISTQTPAFDEEKAYDFTRTLSQNFTRRNVGAVNDSKSADWCAETMRSFGLEVHRQNFTATLYSKKFDLQNVYGISRGKSNEIIVVMAHRDAAPTTLEGANDDASGVGAMLELARIFSMQNHTLTLVFLATDGEEYGMLGAKYFVENFPQRGEIVASFELDMVGLNVTEYLGIHAGGQLGGADSYANLWLINLAVDAGRALNYTVAAPGLDMQFFEHITQISWVDQGPFNRQGIPSITLGGQPTIERIYHTLDDAMDYISGRALKMGGETAEKMVLSMDEAAVLPRGTRVYLRINDNLYLSESMVYLLMFYAMLPLLLKTFLCVSKQKTESSVLKSETVRLLLVLIPFIVALIVLYSTVQFGLLSRFELYPPPPKDPFLYDLQEVPLALVLAAFLVSGALAFIAQRKVFSNYDARLCVCLLALSFASLATFVLNVFAVVALLPFIYFWIPVGVAKKRALNFVLAVLPFFIAVAGLAFLGQIMELDAKGSIWYVVLLLSTEMITPASALLFIVLASAGALLLSLAFSQSSSEPAAPPTVSRRNRTFKP